MVDQGDEFFQGIYVRIDMRIDVSISIIPMITKLGKQLHLGKQRMGLIKQVLVTLSQPDHVRNQKHYISTIRVAVTSKLGRMVSYLNGLLPIKSNDTLITWSCELT